MDMPSGGATAFAEPPGNPLGGEYPIGPSITAADTHLAQLTVVTHAPLAWPARVRRTAVPAGVLTRVAVLMIFYGGWHGGRREAQQG
jgi:hypothetical protein